MGLLDWFRSKPLAQPRFGNDIARDLAMAVFALHPTALDRVIVRLGRIPSVKHRVVMMMEVPAIDPARATVPPNLPERGLVYANVSELAAELASVVPTEGDELTVMRDRVIWLPSVAVFNPPLP